jgi:hypothetical protein
MAATSKNQAREPASRHLRVGLSTILGSRSSAICSGQGMNDSLWNIVPVASW